MAHFSPTPLICACTLGSDDVITIIAPFLVWPLLILAPAFMALRISWQNEHSSVLACASVMFMHAAPAFPAASQELWNTATLVGSLTPWSITMPSFKFTTSIVITGAN